MTTLALADLGPLLDLVAVQRAGFALLLASFALPVIGVVIVGLGIMPVRFAMMHVALLGIAVGLCTGLDPMLCALVACALAGAGVAPTARTPDGLSGAMGLLMSMAIAAALLVLSVSGVNAQGAFALLWGSILSVGKADLWVLGALAVAVPVLFWWRHRDLALLLYDRELALCSGVRVDLLTLLLLVLVAVSVAGAIKLTGALLVDALTLLPALAARRVGRSLTSITVWAEGDDRDLIRTAPTAACRCARTITGSPEPPPIRAHRILGAVRHLHALDTCCMEDFAGTDHTDDELKRLTWETVEARAAQGDVRFARALGAKLAARHAEAARLAREHADCLRHVIHVLALTPGTESVGLLLDLLDESNVPEARARRIASVLAASQSAATLEEAVFARSGHSIGFARLRDLVFQELVLRDAVPEGSWRLRDFRSSSWTPLEWLPPILRDFETQASFPSYSITGESWEGIPSLPGARVDLAAAPATTVDTSRLRNTVTAAEYEQIVGAATAGSWGNSEAWVFRLDKPLDPAEIPALVPALPMRCVEGVGPEGGFDIAAVELGDVWRVLFHTASLGGAYGPSAYGAFGRFAAWRALAGLSGAPAGASAEEVETRARTTTWFRFASDAAWFANDLGKDYGLAALSPDRHRLAILAATDTD